MAQFDYKKFLREGGIEKYLMEANFGNDLESRYEYIRPLMSKLPDSARTEAMIDGMEDAMMEDDKMAFDFYFVETMKMLGLEDELMEPDDVMSEPDYEDYAPDSALGPNPSFVEEAEGEETDYMKRRKKMSDYYVNPEAEEIDDEDLEASADYFDSLAENDDVLDEMLDEGKFQEGDFVRLKNDGGTGPKFAVISTRRMFGKNLEAVRVTDENGKTAEYDETQLVKVMSPEEKANVFVRENKALKASNDLEDALNSVVDELTDEQIDTITDMILDLRDKVKAKKK